VFAIALSFDARVLVNVRYYFFISPINRVTQQKFQKGIIFRVPFFFVVLPKLLHFFIVFKCAVLYFGKYNNQQRGEANKKGEIRKKKLKKNRIPYRNKNN